MPERRARTLIPTAFRAGRVNARGEVRNLSVGGLFVGSDELPEQGDEIELTLAAAGEPPIELHGMVWWTTRDSSRVHRWAGFGLRLLGENERYRRLVERLS